MTNPDFYRDCSNVIDSKKITMKLKDIKDSLAKEVYDEWKELGRGMRENG